jgi:hypothetical protein
MNRTRQTVPNQQTETPNQYQVDKKNRRKQKYGMDEQNEKTVLPRGGLINYLILGHLFLERTPRGHLLQPFNFGKVPHLRAFNPL